MKALTYLILTQAKNRILAIRKKPGLIILYSFIILTIIGSIVFSLVSKDFQINRTYSDNRILFIFFSGFGLLYLYTFIYSGLSTGSTFFTMADVGLLFVAPVSNIKILIYGLLSSIGKTIFASIFIIYQIPNINKTFGYGFMEVSALFFIYVVMVLFCQILSIGVYIFTNGNQNRKNIVKLILYLFIGILIASTYLIMRKENVNIIDAVKLLVDSKWYGFMPVIGWGIMFFKGIITGSLISIILSLAFFALISMIFISMLTSHKADYYEDVLYSTEVQFHRLRDYKEGRNVSSTNSNRKIKVKDNDHGLNKGKGAAIFAYKHLLEMKRSSQFIFVDFVTIMTTVGVGIAGYSLKNENLSYIVLVVIIYIQYFITLFGRLKLELMKPYIYMVPESSFKKLLSASVSSLLKPCVDSIFIFGAFAIVGGAGVLQCIFLALAYSSSGAVFVALTIVYQRILGGQPNKFLQVFIGVSLIFLIFTPAVVVSVLFSLLIIPESMQFLSTLPFTLMNIILSLILFYSCRNLLDNAEYTEGI